MNEKFFVVLKVLTHKITKRHKLTLMVYYSSGELCLEVSVFQTGYCLAKRLSGFDKLGKNIQSTFAVLKDVALFLQIKVFLIK